MRHAGVPRHPQRTTVESRCTAQAWATDFVTLEAVRSSAGPGAAGPGASGAAPLDAGLDGPEVIEVMGAVGLAEAVLLAELDVAAVRDWVELTVRGSAHLPGSVVHIVVTSTPVVLGSTVVDGDGTFTLAADLPLDVLGAGEHRIRVVGIREVDGAIAVEGDAVRLTREGLGEARRYDVGSRVMVALVGRNPAGGSHVAIRVVNLDPAPPWWTLVLIVVVALAAGRMRRSASPDVEGLRRWAVPLVVASGVPAVVLGWTSTVTVVLWAGLGLTLVGATFVAAVRPSGSAPSEPR
jgi:hypothetical protein